jgi:hypothetical protein
VKTKTTSSTSRKPVKTRPILPPRKDETAPPERPVPTPEPVVPSSEPEVKLKDGGTGLSDEERERRIADALRHRRARLVAKGLDPDTASTAPVGTSRPKRPKRDPEDDITAEGWAGLYVIGTDFVASRAGEHWRMTDEESLRFGQATRRVVARYATFLDNPIAQLASLVIVYTVPRLVLTRALAAEKTAEAPPPPPPPPPEPRQVEPSPAPVVEGSIPVARPEPPRHPKARRR